MSSFRQYAAKLLNWRRRPGYSMSYRAVTAFAAIALLATPPVFAFDSPLSEEAVRQAYFLGQRRDDTMTRALDKYTYYLDPPEAGPDIASVTFFTPFALAVESSSQHSAGYSAQQAQIDHRAQKETVKIIVDILLTKSYSNVIVRPTSTRSNSSTGFAPRPYDFWKDFDVQTTVDEKTVRPFTSSGHPNVQCADQGGCDLTGATIELEFLAESFTSSSASVLITPPEGNPVQVEFDLSSLR
jgi:hypothetical protein